MTLADLINQALGKRLDLPNCEVTGVAQDHRRVTPGTVFVARQGELVDGHKYARLAVEAGAAAVVGQKRGVSILPWGNTPYIRVDDDRVALAKLAATFYTHPSRDLHVFGVTGTDGKTTTSFLLHYLLQSRLATGLISTAAVKLGDDDLNTEGHFTTPEATEVQRLLARFRDEGASHAVLESSSHGFALHRLDEVRYDVGVWTNLSPEHLDFHKTLKAYREAKLSLVRRADLSILNRDDASFTAFQNAAERSLSYGEHPDSDWRISGVRSSPEGQRFTLTVAGESWPVHLPMLGRFNVDNAVAALAAAHSADLALDELVGQLASFKGVPGRLQVVQGTPFAAVVDFAHTAPALKNALRTLRPVTQGRLIVVVGAAGERDPAKRRPLGQTAVEEADFAVFTEEDSRSEDVGQILAEMARGAERSGATKANFRCLAERREAIRFAVSLARAGDTLVFAGKGHERSLERSNETLTWNEVAEVEQALSEKRRR